ncbi:MAG TPA: metallophosphoesterase [Acidimicrobiia bacterium]|nr:metallophosphoesterase [Acidimicrobiia bacterium]
MTAIGDAELFTVGPDEVVLTFVTVPHVEVTTRVGEVEVSTTGPYHVARVTGLEPDREYALAVDGADPSELLPATVQTLARPSGRLLATIATANDVHFGETECGILGEGDQMGPILGAAPGHPPYPEVMNDAAVDEIIAAGPDAVVVKGDLTNLGTEQEYDDFLRVYGRLGDVMHHVRGNHDAMITQSIASDRAPFAIDLPGVTLAVLDTVIPGSDRGAISRDQLVWLEELAATTDRPMLVFGHHHPWNPDSPTRSANYFGINPDDSDALVALIARHEAIAGYFAGHTHRNRVRRFSATGSVPIAEVACVKDYPGAWAEYRVYEGGYTQMVHRIGAPAAMDWTERTRQMFAGLYRDYALGSVGDRCFTHAF